MIYHDKENRLMTVNDYTFSVPKDINLAVKNNEYTTEWEDFKFSEFKQTDYKILMELYRDCGIIWYKLLPFANKTDDITSRGKIVLGQLAKNCYIFYISTYQKLKQTKKTHHDISLLRPGPANSWVYHKKFVSTHLRAFLKDQWVSNYDNLLPSSISKLSKLLIADL